MGARHATTRDDPATAAALLRLYMDRHARETHLQGVRAPYGPRGRMESAPAVAALLLGEALLVLGDSAAAAMALHTAIGYADRSSAVALQARRHSVGLYLGPLADRAKATRLCHEIIVEHAGQAASDPLTERPADAEAAQALVEMWTRAPIDAVSLRAVCEQIIDDSEDAAVRLLAVAGLVRALVAERDLAGATELAARTLRKTPSAVRLTDANGPRPFTNIRTSAHVARILEERLRHGDADVRTGGHSPVAVDYAYFVLAALVEGSLARMRDCAAAIAELGRLRSSLPRMPRALERYVRYLWVQLNYDGSTVIGLRHGRHRQRSAEPDPYDYGDVFSDVDPTQNMAFWDPWRRRKVDALSLSRWAADRGLWAWRYGDGGYECVPRGPDALAVDGLGGRRVLGWPGEARAPVRLLAEDATVQGIDGRVGHWVEVQDEASRVLWVFSPDLELSGRGPIFDAAPGAPAPWPTERSHPGRNAYAMEWVPGPMERDVLPFLGRQEAIVADVTKDGGPDILAGAAEGLVAVDGVTWRLAWLHARDGGSAPTVLDGAVFVEDVHAGRRRACALDARTGEALWNLDLGVEPVRPPVCPAPHGELIVYARMGGLAALSADTGEEVWSSTVRTTGALARSGDTVLLVDPPTWAREGRLVSLAARDGQIGAAAPWARHALVVDPAWAYRPGPRWVDGSEMTDPVSALIDVASFAPMRSLPVAGGLDVYVITRRRRRDQWHRNALQAYRRAGNPGQPGALAPSWTYADDQDFVGDPVLTDKTVWVMSEDGRLHGVSRDHGGPVVDAAIPGDGLPVLDAGDARITVAHGRVLVTWRGHPYVFRPRTRAAGW